jgi:hypothetical protein
MSLQTKLPILLVDKGRELIEFMVPAVINLAYQIGMEKLDEVTGDLVLPDLCIPAPELTKALDIRNNIVSKLNSATKTIEALSKPLNTLNTTIDVNSKTLQTLDIAVNIAQVAIPLLPTPSPGAPHPASAALVILGKTKDIITTITDKVNFAKNGVNSISSALDYVNSILSQILNLLNSIDTYLLKCKDKTEELTSLDPYLVKVKEDANKVTEDPNKNQIYQGFLLEIVTEPYSPTVNRVKAVAKNKDGIILLQTPLSFTTTPQVLFEELKLIIDKNNLKAN